jgi:hypothetical protein
VITNHDEHKYLEFYNYILTLHKKLQTNEIVHCGIPCDIKQLFLISIRNGLPYTILLLLLNKFPIENEYLFEAVTCGPRSLSIIKILLDNGAEPYYIHNGQNLLEYAMDKQNEDVVGYLYRNYKYKYECPYDKELFIL